jgi:DNA polymerase-1
MDYMAEVFLNYQTIHIEELIGPRGNNQKNMRDLDPLPCYEYAAEDADITLRAEKRARAETERGELRGSVLRHRDAAGACAGGHGDERRLPGHGVAEGNVGNFHPAHARPTKQRIYELAGEQFNIASPKQVGDILFGKMKIVDKPKKTKTGQYVTSEEVLQSAESRKSEIIEDILNYRGT